MTTRCIMYTLNHVISIEFFGYELQISLSQNVHPMRSKERQLYSQATADRDYIF